MKENVLDFARNYCWWIKSLTRLTGFGRPSHSIFWLRSCHFSQVFPSKGSPVKITIGWLAWGQSSQFEDPRFSDICSQSVGPGLGSGHEAWYCPTFSSVWTLGIRIISGSWCAQKFFGRSRFELGFWAAADMVGAVCFQKWTSIPEAGYWGGWRDSTRHALSVDFFGAFCPLSEIGQ